MSWIIYRLTVKGHESTEELTHMSGLCRNVDLSLQLQWRPGLQTGQ